MRIGRRGSRWTLMVLGGVATPVGAATTFISCDHCLIPRGTVPARMVGQARRAPAATLPNYDLPVYATMGITDRTASRSFGSAHRGFAIETSRRVVKRAFLSDGIAGKREKLSAGSVLMHVDGRVGGSDILSLGLTGFYEKRRFTLDVANGHMVHSTSVGIEGGWDHGVRWSLSGGYRADLGGQGISALTRSIELAQGASRNQKGPWLAINFTPGNVDGDRPLRLGLKMQSMRFSDRDRLALGSASQHDNRAAVTASIRFR